MGEPSGESRKWWTLAAVCVPLFVITANSTAVNTALPAISDELDTSTSNLAWVVNAYLLVTAALVVLGGQFGDLFGRRRMLLLGIVVFIVSSVMIATGSSEVQLIAGRGLQGAGAAFILPGTMSLIDAAFRGAERATAMGIWGAIAGLGFALGPVIGGLLTDTLGWEWVWWANLPIEGVAIALALYGVRESRDEKAPRSVDFAGLVTLGAGLLALVLAVDQGEDWGWGSARIVGLLAGAVVLLAAFWAIERRVRHPLVHLEYFRLPAFVASNIGTFAVTLIVFGVLYLYNLFFQNFLLLDESAIGAGLLLLPLSAALFAVSLAVGWIVQRFEARAPLAIGFALQAVGLAWISQAGADAGIAFFIPPLVVIGAGIGLCFAPTSSVGVSAVPDEKAGEASGVINVSRYLGGALGVAILTVLYTSVALGGVNDRLGEERVGPSEERTLDTILSAAPDVGERRLEAQPAADRADFEEATRTSVADAFEVGNLFMAGLVAATALACLVLLRGHRHPARHHLTHRAVAPGAVVKTASRHAFDPERAEAEAVGTSKGATGAGGRSPP